VIAVTREVIGIRRRAALVLPTNAINPVSLTIISHSSTPIDDSETVIAVAPAVKSVNDTIVSVKEIIIGERPIIISGPGTLIFIPETIIGSAVFDRAPPMARTLLLFSKTAAKKERGSFIKSTSDQVPVLRSKTSVLLLV